MRGLTTRGMVMRQPLPEKTAEKRDRTMPGLRHLMALITTFLAAGSVWAQPGAGPQAPALILDCDFRGSKPLPPEFYLAGAVHDLTVQPGDEGLRLTMSGTKPNGVGRAGLESRM